MVATQLSEPRTANWIADEADWSHEPTTRVLQQLVDGGVVRRDDSGSHTIYYPEYRRQAIQKAMAIRDSSQSAEAITETLTELKSRVRAWEAEFDADSPTQLRATIAAADLDPEAEQRRAEIARQWAHTATDSDRRLRSPRMGVPCADDRQPGGDGMMSAPHPGSDLNAQLYAQLKRDVVDRVPQITSVAFVPNRIKASQLHARFAPDRLKPPTGPDPPELEIVWYRQTPCDWFRIDYEDPNTGFHAGWHQDESHPDLGLAHVQ